MERQDSSGILPRMKHNRLNSTSAPGYLRYSIHQIFNQNESNEFKSCPTHGPARGPLFKPLCLYTIVEWSKCFVFQQDTISSFPALLISNWVIFPQFAAGQHDLCRVIILLPGQMTVTNVCVCVCVCVGGRRCRQRHYIALFLYLLIYFYFIHS